MTINRIIIIGNGFDLAHEMKTSYGDFLRDYYNKVIEEYKLNNNYEDFLLKKSSRNTTPGVLVPNPQYTGDELLIDLFKQSNLVSSSYLFNKIRSAFQNNWVDIERELFNTVHYIIEKKSSISFIQNLNEEFNFIKKLLIDYLRMEQSKLEKRLIDPNVFVEQFMGIDYELQNRKLNEVLFLNFNYTSTIDTYVTYAIRKNKGQVSKIHSCYIHGSIHRVFGDPIFGMGQDDVAFDNHPWYHEIYKSSKLFQYNLNNNYEFLHQYLNGLPHEMLEVQIYGHSCGISDNELLKRILNKAHRIKLFYFDQGNGINDYQDKVIAISQHLENKADVLKKIVPLNKSIPMPKPEFIKGE